MQQRGLDKRPFNMETRPIKKMVSWFFMTFVLMINDRYADGA